MCPDAREVVLSLPELMEMILQHLSLRELLWRMPLVSRAWRDHIRLRLRYRRRLRFDLACHQPLLMVLATERLLYARSVELVSPTVFDVECLPKLKGLEDLAITDCTRLTHRSYRILRRFSLLRELRLEGTAGEALLEMVQGPSATFRGLARLSATFSADSSLAQHGPAVLRTVAATPALEVLELPNFALSQSMVATVLRVCPKMRELHVGKWGLGTEPACLEAMGRYGPGLERVTFTLKRVFDFIDGPESCDRTRKAYVTNAAGLFAACPRLAEVKLQNVEPQLRNMFACPDVPGRIRILGIKVWLFRARADL